MTHVAIIGGGMAGLGAAHEIERSGGGIEYRVFERESRLGGLCRTESENGFLFDYTGHLLHFRGKYFENLVRTRIGNNLVERTRSAWIYSKGVFTQYPFQANLRGLPEEVVVDCVYEFARQSFANDVPVIETFYDWIVHYFGTGIAEHFMVPYNTKLYQRSPKELTPDCIGRFVPSSDLRLLLSGILSSKEAHLGYNSTFYYPAHGGTESLVHALAEGLEEPSLGETVVEIDPTVRALSTDRGRREKYDYLISTQPLPLLIESMKHVPYKIREAARALSHVSVLNINLGVEGDPGDGRHWIYVPESKFIFHRAGFPSAFSDNVAPTDCGSIYLEIAYDPELGIDREYALNKSIGDLRTMGILRENQSIPAEKTIDIPYAYVVFNRARQISLSVIREYLAKNNIFSVGRFGAWEYTSMEDAFMQGVSAVREINETAYELGKEVKTHAFARGEVG